MTIDFRGIHWIPTNIFSIDFSVTSFIPRGRIIDDLSTEDDTNKTNKIPAKVPKPEFTGDAYPIWKPSSAISGNNTQWYDWFTTQNHAKRQYDLLSIIYSIKNNNMLYVIGFLYVRL